MSKRPTKAYYKKLEQIKRNLSGEQKEAFIALIQDFSYSCSVLNEYREVSLEVLEYLVQMGWRKK